MPDPSPSIYTLGSSHTGNNININTKEAIVLDSTGYNIKTNITFQAPGIKILNSNLFAGRAINLEVKHVYCDKSTISAPDIYLPSENNINSVNCNFQGRIHYTEFQSETNHHNTNTISDHLRLGDIFLKNQEYDSAIAEFTKVLEIDQKNLNALFKRSVAFSDDKQFDQALKDISEFLEYDPTNILALTNRGIYYKLQGLFEKAIPDLSRAIALDAKYLNAYYARSDAYLELKDSENAIKDYTIIISLNSQAIEAYEMRASIYYDLGNFEKAIEDFTKCIDIKVSARNYNNLGLSYLRSGQYDKAIIKYAVAAILEPNNYNTYANLGEASLHNKQFDTAINYYNIAFHKICSNPFTKEFDVFGYVFNPKEVYCDNKANYYLKENCLNNDDAISSFLGLHLCLQENLSSKYNEHSEL